MTGYHHGLTISEVAKGVRPIQEPPTCVIALVCTAPVHLVDPNRKTVNKPTLVLTDRDAAAAFGPDLAGFTGPDALNAILEYGTAKIVVVNVFDPAIHKTSVTGESITLNAEGTAPLSKTGLITATVKNSGGTTTYVQGTDYDLDRVAGKVTRKSTGTIPALATLKVDFDYGDPSKVLATDIIGTVTAGGNRTGLQALLDVPSTLGIKPRIILAPGWATQQSVSSAMTTMADKLKGHAYLDAPIGTTFQQALESRGVAGAINFTTASPRAVLCYPHVQVADPASGNLVLEPLSQNLAGLASFMDLTKGYWASPSNNELRRVQATERPIGWSLTDPNCEASLLNSVGIVTVVRGFGTGFLAWGNRSAAWPTNTHPLNFICVRVVADILHEALERASLPYIDRPLTRAQLDAIREDVNLFISTLVTKGALLGGACSWDPADNPEDQMALGKAKFRLSFLPPVPLEGLEFESQIDTAWLKTLYLGQSA